MTAEASIFEGFNYLKYFVETGTHKGGGVQKALNSGFSSVYSMEIHEPAFRAASKRFKDNENVNLFLGSSNELLGDILSKFEGPALFWLDAHFSGEGTGGRGTTCTDITLSELKILESGKYKAQNVILIDDMRDQNREKLTNFVRTCFPEHVIEYFFANNHADDIMCIRKLITSSIPEAHL